MPFFIVEFRLTTLLADGAEKRLLLLPPTGEQGKEVARNGAAFWMLRTLTGKQRPSSYNCGASRLNLKWGIGVKCLG